MLFRLVVAASVAIAFFLLRQDLFDRVEPALRAAAFHVVSLSFVWLSQDGVSSFVKEPEPSVYSVWQCEPVDVVLGGEAELMRELRGYCAQRRARYPLNVAKALKKRIMFEFFLKVD